MARKRSAKKGSDKSGAAPKKRYAKGSPAKKVRAKAKNVRGGAKQSSCPDKGKVFTTCGTERITCPFCTWPGMILLVLATILVAWGHPYAKYLAWIFLLAAILSPWLMKLLNRHHG